MKNQTLLYQNEAVGVRTTNNNTTGSIDFAYSLLDTVVIEELQNKNSGKLTLELVEGVLKTKNEENVTEWQQDVTTLYNLYRNLENPTLSGRILYALNGTAVIHLHIRTDVEGVFQKATVDLLVTSDQSFTALLNQGYVDKTDRPLQYPSLLRASYPYEAWKKLRETYVTLTHPAPRMYEYSKNWNSQIRLYPVVIGTERITSDTEFHAYLQKTVTFIMQDRYYENNTETLDLTNIVNLT